MQISLQPWQLPDAIILANHYNNLSIWNNLRDYIPHPYTIEEADRFILSQLELFPARNFAITNGREIVGGIGIVLLDDVYRMNVELGYWVAEPYWNQGIATAAVGMMSDYVFANLAINRIVAEVFDYNRASMRVLEKNGYFLETVRRKGILKNNFLLDNFIWVKQKIY